jgi:hypothetical protein
MHSIPPSTTYRDSLPKFGIWPPKGSSSSIETAVTHVPEIRLMIFEYLTSSERAEYAATFEDCYHLLGDPVYLIRYGDLVLVKGVALARINHVGRTYIALKFLTKASCSLLEWEGHLGGTYYKLSYNDLRWRNIGIISERVALRIVALPMFRTLLTQIVVTYQQDLKDERWQRDLHYATRDISNVRSTQIRELEQEHNKISSGHQVTLSNVFSGITMMDLMSNKDQSSMYKSTFNSINQMVIFLLNNLMLAT